MFEDLEKTIKKAHENESRIKRLEEAVRVLLIRVIELTRKLRRKK